MKTLKFACLTIIAALSSSLNAQTSYETARLIGEDLNGTARFIGMGGAMSAFGSDISTISTNPAGIGTYKKSDANISISFIGTKTSMDSPGNGPTHYYSNDNQTAFRTGFENVSFVLHNPINNQWRALKSFNFAFTYKKVRDFEKSISYFDDFIDENSYQVYRDFENTEEGRINSYNFNFSFNYFDQIFWGLTVGMLDANYWANGYFYDYYPIQTGFTQATDYTSVDRMNEFYGHGWNLRLGVLLRPIVSSSFRIGLSLSTPTWFSMTQGYSDYLYALEGVEKDGILFSDITDYKVTTPWEFNISTGITISDSWAIGAEYEVTAAERTNIIVNGFYIDNQNRHDLQPFSTYKVGLEKNIGLLSIRAGYNYILPTFKSSAYKDLDNTDFNKNRFDFDFENSGKQHNITFGLGYCSEPGHFGDQFYIDAAYVHNIRKSAFSVGEYNDDPVVDYTTSRRKLVLTAGFLF